MGIAWHAPLRTRLPLLAAAALPLAGCSTAANGPADEAAAESTSIPSPAASAPPMDGGYYNDPRTIVEKAAGAIPCSDLAEAETVGAREQVTCSDGNIVIRVHDNGQGVNGQLDLMKLTGGDLLTGQNWTVNASPAVLRAARTHLGGKITHVPCSPPECALEASP